MHLPPSSILPALILLTTSMGCADRTPDAAVTRAGGAIGGFAAHGDVGTPALAGDAAYDAAQQTYTVSGAGLNIWGTTDQFHFVHQRVAGDFILQARVRFSQQGITTHRKCGLMMRDGLSTDAPHINAVVHGDGLTSLQFRKAPGATTGEQRMSLTGADVLQLERRGSRCIISAARFGEPLTSCAVEDIPLPETVEVGLFVCSHDAALMDSAVFSAVRLITPAREGYRHGTDPMASALEILDVEDGSRRVVHRSPTLIEAPNWTPDGSSLIFNGGGRLHRCDLASNAVSSIDTGDVRGLNNDHVLSADGQRIAISHRSAAQGPSLISILPVTGGTPRLVTPTGPSYLHGWSPDGSTLLFTGKRAVDKDYNIYAVPAAGGAETRLTDAVGLDDGAEYAPDGTTIWFNSSRTGSMQIWRMNSAGGDQVQITHDLGQNWFPHVSPDGRWVVFVSYAAEVPAEQHPPCKQVVLRLMPASGGEPRVIAYLYGGQGTMNVPSWAPDSRRLAFMSFGCR